MRIKSLRMQNFKRFSDFRIHSIPKSAKLVLVVGPNGCGKSSLFDALLHWYRMQTNFGINGDVTYYQKEVNAIYNWQQVVVVNLHDDAKANRDSPYIRTAYRMDPDFTVGGITRLNSPTDGIRVNRFIDLDQSVAENYARLAYDTMSEIYNDLNNAKTVEVLREELIGGIRQSMKNVFEDLHLNSIADPLGQGTFTFEKGGSKNYQYKNLSGGEKSGFNLLLDIHIKKRFYPDAIYCIDELETHLHTRVQGKLLKEIVRIIPNSCQIWVTTHSLGVLRAAQELFIKDANSVSILDFEGVSPDVPCELAPSGLGRVTWEKFLSITLDDLSPKIAPSVVVVCEGSSSGRKRKNFDAEIYNKILGNHHPEYLFVSGGSTDQVEIVGTNIKEVLGSILKASSFTFLIDRDDKSQTQVDEIIEKGGIVLHERNIESLLFADDVLEALLILEGKNHLLDNVIELKNNAIKSSVSRGNASDDVKSAAGEIYVQLKKLLNLTRCGSGVDSFMRDTLAPLIVPSMNTYQLLKKTIIDR